MSLREPSLKRMRYMPGQHPSGTMSTGGLLSVTGMPSAAACETNTGQRAGPLSERNPRQFVEHKIYMPLL